MYNVAWCPLGHRENRSEGSRGSRGMIRPVRKEAKKERWEGARAALGAAGACLLFLAYWELLTHRLTQGGFGRFTGWVLVFLPSLAALLSCAAGCFRKAWAGRALFFLAMLLPAVFYTADAVYYLCFGSLFSVSMLGMGGQAMGDFMGPALLTMRDNWYVLLAFLLPAIGLAIHLAVSGRKGRERKRIGGGVRACAALLALALWFGAAALLPLGGKQDHTAYGAYHSRYVDTDTASAKIGALPNALVEAGTMLFGGIVPEEEIGEAGIQQLEPEKEPEEERTWDDSPHALDAFNFGTLSLLTGDKKTGELLKYLSSVPATRKNEYTGRFRGYNLIYICAESFSTMCVDEEVTPTLYRLAHGGIVCTNYYNSFKNTTTNGEYAFLTGIWPDVSRDAGTGKATGTMAQSASRFMPTALGNAFNAAFGIRSRGYHNFKGEYYRRDRSLPNFGFDCRFMGSGMSFSTAWPSSDLEMMEQSVDDYLYAEEPFCAYYMTFSGHGTYSDENPMVVKNWSFVKETAGDRGLSSYALGYLAANRELDRAMEYLLRRLEEAGQLDRTVIVLAGDHYPYYVSKANRDALSGHEVDEAFEMYKSTLILWTPSMEAEPLVVDAPCCTVDVLPTVLNLFGVEYDSRLYAGTDILSDAEHMAILYNKNFVTDKVMYDNATGKAVWLTDVSGYAEEELRGYLESRISAVKARYQFSVGVASTDLYRFLWKESGLD